MTCENVRKRLNQFFCRRQIFFFEEAMIVVKNLREEILLADSHTESSSREYVDVQSSQAKDDNYQRINQIVNIVKRLQTKVLTHSSASSLRTSGIVER
jgi:hypothetical protein